MANLANKKRGSMAIIGALCIISLVSVTQTDWGTVRSVDMVKLLAAGMLLGIFLTRLVGMLKKENA